MTTPLPVWIVMLAVAAAPMLGWAQSPGIDDVIRLDRLPIFKNSARVASVSSYDRTGGNDDGFSGKYSFVRQEADTLVLADLKGPGVIWRIWTPTPTEDTLEFLFDGESTPRIALKYLDLFLGKHPAFPSPFTGFGAGGYYCYVPLPFAKSCVVRIRAPKTQFYQINYSLYDQGTPITTFDPQGIPLVKVRQLLGKPGADLSGMAATPGSRITHTAASKQIAPNTKVSLFNSEGGGRIVGLRISPTTAIASKQRDLLLRITFDGQEPSVLCPLGDFFGYSWGEPAMQSALLGTSGDTNYCYFPMPFRKSASIEVISERSAPVQLHAEILHTSEAQKDNEGQFGAVWRRENPTRLGEPFTFVDLQGRGHIVGLVLQSQGFESGKTLFFEGDDQTTIDGELVIHGTGSEDLFNGGWYDVPDRWEKRLSFPLSGCLGYAKPLGRTGGYRFFLGDAYAFRQSIKQTIEHAGEGNSILTDYAAVTYLYSDRPAAGPAPALDTRAVVDLTELIFPATWQLPIYAWSFDNGSLTRRKTKVGSDEVRSLSLSATGGDWFGHHFLSPVVEVPVGGRYAIFVEVLKGPGQAMVRLFHNENPVAEGVDFYSVEPVRSSRVLMGHLDLAEGRNNLMFKLTGKNAKSAGLGFDLISIALTKE